MKKISILVIGIVLAIAAQGQTVKINVGTPGTLGALLAGYEQIETLRLSGTLDDSDVLAICQTEGLKHLNLRRLKNKSLPDSAFFGMTSLVTARLPRRLTQLGASAFEGCSRLESVEMSDYLTRIPDRMLKDCSRLDKLTLRNSYAEHIGAGAFMRSGIRIIILPEQLRTIGATAFAECSRLERIYLKKWVSSIGPLAFAECISLRAIGIASDTPPHCAADAFAGLKGCTLYVRHPEFFRDREPWNAINLSSDNYNGNELRTFDQSDIKNM